MKEEKLRSNVVVTTFRDFLDDDCPRMAAALAYYVVFALPPLLVLILMVTGVFMSAAEVEAWIGQQLSPRQGDQIGAMVESANQKLAAGSTFALMLGIAGLLFSATGAFRQLQKALNSAWEVEPDPEIKGARKVLHMLTKRLISLGMIVVMAFLVVIAMSISGLLSTFTGQVADFLAPIGLPPAVAQVAAWTADAVVSMLVLTIIFGGMFMFLPDVRTRWRDVRFGAFITAILFVAGKILIGWYIGRSNPGEAFGAAAALAAILIFVYYASMIALLGAEFTQVWARRHGKAIRPSKYAVRVVEEKRHIREDGTPAEPRARADRSRVSTRSEGSLPDRGERL